MGSSAGAIAGRQTREQNADPAARPHCYSQFRGLAKGSTLLAMTVGPGTQLGPYRILAPLGARGTGEVYRAHDTRHGRGVAIKVLPAEVAAHP